MSSTPYFIETKEYKKFAEFCDACAKYKYIGICYGLPGVGKTLSARYYANWDFIEKQMSYNRNEMMENADEQMMEAKSLFYTAPAVQATKMTHEVESIVIKLNLAKSMYKKAMKENEGNSYALDTFEHMDLVIVDEIDRLKLQHLEQLRDIYDQNNIAMIFIGMPGIEKRLARYPQLFSRIGFAHEFGNLSKEETHHILTYKWQELGFSIKLEDFSDYEAITTIIKITNGNFRLIQRLFTQIDRILEINHLEKITTEVVETARESLVIGIK